MKRIYTVEQVAAARDAGRKGWTIARIAEHVRIPRAALPDILRGVTYRDVPGALTPEEYRAIKQANGPFRPAVVPPADPIQTTPDDIIAEAVRHLATVHRRTTQDIRDIARAYRGARSVHAVARTLGLPWPIVHCVVFDLRRAGVDLPRRERRAA